MLRPSKKTLFIRRAFSGALKPGGTRASKKRYARIQDKVDQKLDADLSRASLSVLKRPSRGRGRIKHIYIWTNDYYKRGLSLFLFSSFLLIKDLLLLSGKKSDSSGFSFLSGLSTASARGDITDLIFLFQMLSLPLGLKHQDINID